RRFPVLVVILLAVGALSTGGVLAQALQTNAGAVAQVLTQTSSAEATYSNPSGAFQALPDTPMAIDVKTDSMLVITFSARGTVQPSSTGAVPIVFIKCQIDRTPCQPDFNSVEFLYPQFCCDSAHSRGLHLGSQKGPTQSRFSGVWGIPPLPPSLIGHWS